MKLMDFMRFKRNIVISLLAGILVAISACDGVARSSEELLESAQVYLDNNNFASAVVELKNALQQDTNNIEARKLLGDVYLQIGKGEDAEKEIRRAISFGMSPASGATSLAQALLLQGKFQQVLDSPIELEAGSKAEQAKLLALRGNAHFGLGNLTIAENSYDRALSLDASSIYALMGKSRMKTTRGDFEGAKAIAEKASAINPTFAPIWELLGDIHHAQDQLDSAEVMYTKAIKQGHFLSESSLKRAGVRLQKEDYVALKEDTDKLIEAGYQSPHLFYFKGRVDFFNEAYPDAEQAFKSALEINPKFWPAKVYLASTHLFLGQQQQALDLAQQLQSDAPDQHYLKGLLGATYANVGQFNQAKKALTGLISADPHNIFGLSLLAQISLNEGRAEEAQVYLRRALLITPESKSLQHNLKIANMMAGGELDFKSTDYDDVFLRALSELKNGEFRKAYDIAEHLRKQKPSSVDPLNLSAAALMGLGDLNSAKKAFEQALVLEMNNPTAAKNLATIEWRTGSLDRASEILAKYLEQYPQDENGVLKLAMIEFQRKNTDQATALLNQFLDRNPESAAVRAALAQQFFNAHRYEELLTLTSNLSEPWGQAQPILWELRGKVNLLRNEITLALADFKKLVSLLPGSAHSHFVYADALSRAGEKRKAKEELQRAIDADATYLSARTGWIKMLAQHLELDQAKLAMSQLKKDFGEIPAVLGLEGWLALGLSDFAGAEKSLSAAIEQAPNSELSLLLFRSMWAQGKYDQAFSVLNARLEQRPKERVILEELGAAKLAKGEDSEAANVYSGLVEAYPDHVVALNNLAWLSRDENLGQAIDYAERAKALAPDSAGVADTLAMLLLQKDPHSQRAFNLLRKAAQAGDSSPQIQLHYAAELVKREMHTQARTQLNVILESFPGTATASEAAVMLEKLSH